MAQNPDWQSLARKLEAGKPLALACEEVGISVEVAQKYLAEQNGNIELFHSAVSGLALENVKFAFEKLRIIAEEGHRVAVNSKLGGESYYNTDVDALRAILRGGIDLWKLSSGFGVTKMKAMAEKKNADTTEKVIHDLFDIQGGLKGNWKLKDPHSGE